MCSSPGCARRTATRHQTSQSRLRHQSTQAVQDRRADQTLRAPCPHPLRQRLPLPTPLPESLATPPTLPLALLSGASRRDKNRGKRGKCVPSTRKLLQNPLKSPELTKTESQSTCPGSYERCGLARISHRSSTVTADKATLTGLFSPFDLDVTRHAVVRKASDKSRHSNFLHRLATKTGEISGLRASLRPLLTAIACIYVLGKTYVRSAEVPDLPTSEPRKCLGVSSWGELHQFCSKRLTQR